MMGRQLKVRRMLCKISPQLEFDEIFFPINQKVSRLSRNFNFKKFVKPWIQLHTYTLVVFSGISGESLHNILRTLRAKNGQRHLFGRGHRFEFQSAWPYSIILYAEQIDNRKNSPRRDVW